MIEYGIKLLAIVLCCFYADASFLYGQPCSVRNTAYLYSTTWTIPDNATQCVDLTGYRKQANKPMLETFLSYVPEATTLYADHMNLSLFPSTVLRALPHLELIDLSGNHIRRVRSILTKVAPHLNKLLLADNLLRMNRKRPLLQSKTLQMLMISRNKIGKIYPISFSKLPALEILYLDGNAIMKIQPEYFVPLSMLKYLHLGDNAISVFPPKEKMPPKLIYYIQKKQKRPIK